VGGTGEADGREYAWTVMAYGGDSEQEDPYDPFSHDDRGIYFNGYNKFVTIQSLQLGESFTLDTWIKP
jgi:hypothetical protein